MPDTNGFGGYPIPLMAENANASVAFADFRAALAPHTVLFATSEANRNSLYGSGATTTETVPNGTLVSSSSGKTVWQKSPTGWNTVYSDTGWVSLAGASWLPDFEDAGSYYRIINSCVFLEFRATYTGADDTANSTGNINNHTMCGLPSAIRPVRSASNIAVLVSLFANYSGMATIYQSSGNITLATASPGLTISSGMAVYGNVTYFV